MSSMSLECNPLSASRVIERIAAIEGPVDLYCWYEGTQCLPEVGARYMKEELFDPLQEVKKDVKYCLYSLKGWDFAKNLSKMRATTPLGEAINQIDRTVVECFYASSFFRWCTEVNEPLYAFVQEELPKKDWLFGLSAEIRDSGKKIAEFFEGRRSLFDCIREMDCSKAYSAMQYMEGYYLVREAVERRLSLGQKRIDIAFVFANDECKYYVDLQKELSTMLALEFGERELDLNVTFHTFQYGDSLKARPYIDKRPGAPKVTPAEIAAYWRG